MTTRLKQAPAPKRHDDQPPCHEKESLRAIKRHEKELRRRTQRLHLDRRAGQLIQLGQGDPNELLTDAELRAWFRCSKSWLAIGRSVGQYGPPFLRVGPNMIRYRRGAVLQWLKQRERLASLRVVK